MGLFSFLKNAGEKIFHTKKEATLTAEEVKTGRISQLQGVASMYRFEIEGVSLDLNEAGDIVTVFGQTSSWEDKEKLILALGNVRGIAGVDDRISIVPTEAEEEIIVPEPVFYEVKSGDSLSKISKKFYGDAMKYNAIFEANKPMLKDVNLIYPGQMLRIPEL